MIEKKLYLKPNSVNEGILMACEHENDFRFVSGGTDFIVNKFQGNDSATCFIDLTGIQEMQKIETDDTYLHLGSLVKLDNLKNSPEIVKHFPILLEAAKYVASPVIRKTATLGGNVLCENRCSFYNQSEWWREAVGYCLKCSGDICIATGGDKNCFSKFVSDMAVALIGLDASIEVIDKTGGFTMSLVDLYTGNGVQPRKLTKTAVIKSIQIPLHQEFRSVFKKLRQRESLEFTSLTTAVVVNKAGRIKIVLGGVDPKPIVVEGTTKDDIGEMIKKAVKKPRTIDNDVYSRAYRKEMIAVFLKRSFMELKVEI